MRTLLILPAVLMLLLAENAMAVGAIAPFTGEYWYDWIGNDDSGTQPGAESGTVTITSNSVNMVSSTWPNAGPNDFELLFTDASLNADGYLTLQTNYGPASVFANGHFVSQLRSDPTNGPLSHALMVQKAHDPTVSGIEGDYAVFRYAMHTDETFHTDGTEGVLGTASISAGVTNDWTLNFVCVDSSGIGYGLGGGNWTVDASASTMTLTGTPSVSELKIGTGGILTSTVVDEAEEGDPARLMLIKKGSGRTIAEAVGHYTLHGCGSSTAGDDFWTNWGTLDIFDDGTWTATTYSSNDENHEVSAGMFSIADDGMVTIADNDGGEINGVLSLDGDLIAFVFGDLGGEGEDGEINAMLAMRPLVVPEPSMLALLLIGSLGWMVFRNRE